MLYNLTLAGFFLFVVDYIALTDYAVEYHPCRVSFLFVIDVISLLLYFDMLVCQTPSPCGYSLKKRELKELKGTKAF